MSKFDRAGRADRTTNKDASDDRSQDLEATEDTEADAAGDSGIYEGLAAFRYALRRFLAFSDVIAAASGVTAQQYQAMLVIRSHPGESVSIGELAEEMLLVPNGAVQLVDRLVAAGFVERRRSPLDRRSVRVSLTRSGRCLLEQLAADHLRELLAHEPLLAESLARLRQIGRRSETQ